MCKKPGYARTLAIWDLSIISSAPPEDDVIGEICIQLIHKIQIKIIVVKSLIAGLCLI
jgi:hypothetical protein